MSESETKILRNALSFYANRDNYWGAPLSLDARYDRRTMQAMRKAEKENKVLVDFGKKARKALEKSRTPKPE